LCHSWHRPSGLSFESEHLSGSLESFEAAGVTSRDAFIHENGAYREGKEHGELQHSIPCDRGARRS